MTKSPKNDIDDFINHIDESLLLNLLNSFVDEQGQATPTAAPSRLTPSNPTNEVNG